MPSVETMTTQSQHGYEIDDITPNPSSDTPQQQDTGESEVETVSRKLLDSTEYTHYTEFPLKLVKRGKYRT